MAALRNAGGYTVVVPDEALNRYLDAGWEQVGAKQAAAESPPKKRARKPRQKPPAPVVEPDE